MTPFLNLNIPRGSPLLMVWGREREKGKIEVVLGRGALGEERVELRRFGQGAVM